jgi:hypothetical protein
MSMISRRTIGILIASLLIISIRARAADEQPAPADSSLVAQKVRPEGGGGNYGPNSGGFDLLGYGTLTDTLDTSRPDH